MNKPFKAGPGEWVQKLDDKRFLGWGWRFFSNGDRAFSTVRTTSSVRVFCQMETVSEDGTSSVVDLVPETVVGRARTVADARKIGAAGVRNHVSPAVKSVQRIAKLAARA